MCKDLNLFDNGKLSMGEVNIAYQSALNHHVVAFGAGGLHQGKRGSLRQIEHVRVSPTGSEVMSVVAEELSEL